MEFFKLKENKTTVKKEIVAGITTFMTMAYILAVNPNILSAAGMNQHGVFVATILSSVIGTVLMALLANYPFALAPGMGLNAFFAFTVVLTWGYSWQFALAAVFVEGIIFILLTLCNVREALFNAIPGCMKASVSAGIGLFIAFLGFKGAGVVVADPSTFLTLGNMLQPQTVLCMVGILLIVILMKRNIKGAMLIGIIVTWLLGVGAELIGWYQVDVEAGVYSLIPNFTSGQSLFGGLSEVAFKFPSMNEIFGSAESLFTFIVVMFSFLFVDLFDTLGTLMGVAEKADYLDEKGQLPKIKEAFFADAIATTTGALLGTSTVTTYVESAAGVMEGGRTGLTALTTAGCFILSLFLAPIFMAIPSFATAPALVVVGVLMIGSIVKVDFDDITEALPAFLTVAMMTFTASISEGIIFGGIAYVVVKFFTGKKKDISVMMYVLAALFVAKLVLSSAIH
ncbi:guanine permease [Sporanaerobium hydrogeniformans]|uniref:Guanine permease n=1 Tax=Sporanaerobium hydrogeniformans TaxID=3072179 RepID=A0AC61DEK2_9FIRM|nr:NCS2 family permease [Sporanaerobium hydrogeniformans]PHV71589.1 guanine permease [Sporanaerobium hydrogeniformans]